MKTLPSTLNRSLRRHSRTRQKGMILILTLVFAALMMLLAAGAVRTASVAESMSGNMRNRNLSLQVAEAAIASAQVKLANTMVLVDSIGQIAGTGTGDYAFSSTRSLMASNTKNPGLPDFWRNFAWNATNANTVSTTVNGQNRTAYYVIEELQVPANVPGSSIAQAFRVTAYGQGGSNEAVSLLQATYTR